METFLIWLSWTLLGYGVKHTQVLYRWWRARGIALKILESPEGTDEPEEAMAQAVVLLDRKRIKSESIQVARAKRDSDKP